MAAKFVVVAMLVAVAHGSAILGHGHGEDYTSFSYGVSDPHTGDVKSQHETRHGDNVVGQYSLIDSDGTKRTVDYAADAHSGFNAIVRKDPLYAHVAHAPVVAHAAPLAYAAAPVAHAAPLAYGAYGYGAHGAYAAPLAHHGAVAYGAHHGAYAAPLAHHGAYAAPLAHHGAYAAPLAHHGLAYGAHDLGYGYGGLGYSKLY